MNEETNRPGRKVLISVKVSTLLLIIIAIICAIIIVKNVPNVVNYFTNDTVATDEEKLVSVETNISSRSLEQPRATENVVTEENTNPVENTEVIEVNAQEASVEQASVSSTDILQPVGSIESEKSTISIEEVIISKDMDLTQRTGLSRENFITLISNVEEDSSNFFEENAGLIYDLCEKYQLNEIFFCGLISAESGWGIATNHRRTYNYISLMSNSGGLIKYQSVEDGLEKAARFLHEKYLTAGGSFFCGTTLAAVKTKFCPASSTWVDLVYGRMNQILN